MLVPLLECISAAWLIGFVGFRFGDVCMYVTTPAALVTFVVMLMPLRFVRARVTFLAASLLVYLYVDTYLYTSPLAVDLTGTLVVVTGANSGVGLETTRALLEMNATVVMACRNLKRCTTAAGTLPGDVRTAVLDIESLASVKEFVTNVVQEHGVPSMMINNAGFGGTTGLKTKEGFEYGWGAMHMGHYALTEWVIGHYGNESSSSSPRRLRVVNIASGTHHICMFVGGCLNDEFFTSGWALPSDGWLSYYRAKLANVLHAAEVPQQHSNVDAYSVDLGFVNTAIHGFSWTQQLGWMRGTRRGAIPIVYAAIGKGLPNGCLVDPWLGTWKPFVLESRVGLQPKDAHRLPQRAWVHSQKALSEKWGNKEKR